MSQKRLNVRVEAAENAALRGVIGAGSPFVVLGTLAGPGCDLWGAVAAGGFACLDGTEVTTELPAPHPLHGDLPFVYARHAAPVYASVAAFEAGARPRRALDGESTFHFVDRVSTTRGDVLVREDGTVVPAAKMSIYEPSPFAGRNLLERPIPEGATLGWCVTTSGCPMPDGTLIDWHGEFVSTDGTLPGGRVRVFRPGAVPDGVGPDEVWLDGDIGQQVIAVMRGPTPEYVTLMSTGMAGERFETPKGEKRLFDKLLANDMVNLPDAPERYHVDQVPWVMHFRPRFALHGAFWHDRFGFKKSHGCVNLSAADARYIFFATEPALPDGWRAIYGEGTMVRMR